MSRTTFRLVFLYLVGSGPRPGVLGRTKKTRPDEWVLAVPGGSLLCGDAHTQIKLQIRLIGLELLKTKFRYILIHSESIFRNNHTAFAFDSILFFRKGGG